jgi:hypothetical protein
MERPEILKLVSLALASFPNMQEKDPEPTVVIWEKFLKDIPYELAEKALTKVIITSKFFPTIAEIREAAMSFSTSELASPEEAWGEVRKYITSGTNSIRFQYAGERPTWSNPIIEKTVDQIGLREMFESENQEYLRSQFMRIYEANFDREKNDVINKRAGYLTGNVVKLNGI